MRRRTLVLILVGLAVLAAVAVVLVRAQHGPPAIASKAVGSWIEADRSHPKHMTIVKTGVDDYAVRDPAVAGATPWIATLEGGHIQVWGENAISDPRYQIHYDDAHDQLVVNRDSRTIRLDRTAP